MTKMNNKCFFLLFYPKINFQSVTVSVTEFSKLQKKANYFKTWEKLDFYHNILFCLFRFPSH